MKHLRRSVLLWYSAREMYELVTAVEDYPRFLPWCERAEVLGRHPDGVTARLSLSYAGVRHAFTTRNAHAAHEAVTMQLVDGPFARLEGSWAFRPIEAVPVDRQACRGELDLRYAFSSSALEALLSPVFDKIAATLVDSFVSRAESVYGLR
ncbi:MAG: type II toxin-antitoxin system RatA family toxin [Rubrivivax sp.]